jgi:hypothetical protein
MIPINVPKWSENFIAKKKKKKKKAEKKQVKLSPMEEFLRGTFIFFPFSFSSIYI